MPSDIFVGRFFYKYKYGIARKPDFFVKELTLTFFVQAKCV